MYFLFCGWIFRLVTSPLLLYGLIFAQVTSALLVLWFDCRVSHKRVLGFMACIDCCTSHKRVPGFMVRLMRMSRALSCFYVLIVAQLTIAFLVVFDCPYVISAFLVLCFDYYSSYKRVPGFMVSFLNKLPVCSWFFCLIVSQVTSAFLVLRFHCRASYKRVLGFMV